MHSQFRELFDELRAGFGCTAAEFTARLKQLLNEDLERADRHSLVQLCDLLLGLDNGEEARSAVTRKLTSFVTPVRPANREKHFREFAHLWASGILDAIPHVPEPLTESLPDAFAAVAKNPDGWDPKFAILAKFSDNDLRAFLQGLQGPHAMAQIKRARDRSSRTDDLSEPDRKLLVEKFDRVLEQISAVDPLFRIKVRDFATPKGK